MCPPYHGKTWTNEVEPLGALYVFWNYGEEVKGTLGIRVTTMLDWLKVFKGVDGLDTRALGDTGVDELKFKDTTSVVEILDLSALRG